MEDYSRLRAARLMADSAKPLVSVLIATYNRSRLLRRALGSVLKQDFVDYEVVVVDDFSSDDTPEVMRSYACSRIRYIRNCTNIGRVGGDREIFRRFVYEYARGEFFVYLCDDDYWIPSDLLSRQVAALRADPSLAMVAGGQVQIYPDRLQSLPTVETYWHYEWVPEVENGIFMKDVYPGGHIDRFRFLGLFAADPVTRNILTGATLFRRSAFMKARVLKRRDGSHWQSGYELTAGTATAGDVYYLNEPCIASQVDIKSASFRGTQKIHMLDCLKAVSIAFHACRSFSNGQERDAFQRCETKIKHGIIFNYILNKLGYRLGWFSGGALAEIERIFVPEIHTVTFLWQLLKHRIPLTKDNWVLLWLTLVPKAYLPRYVAVHQDRISLTQWHNVMKRYDARHDPIAVRPTTA